MQTSIRFIALYKSISHTQRQKLRQACIIGSAREIEKRKMKKKNQRTDEFHLLRADKKLRTHQAELEGGTNRLLSL